MRLDKFLSKATELSRKEAKKVLHASKVSVNGEIIKDTSYQVDEKTDDIVLGGESLSVATENRYLLLYKPEGFECTLKAKNHPIVTELIAIPEVNRLRIAGRLDVDTTGALLLSDDGKWLHRITSPKHAHAKIYHLTLAEPIDKQTQQKVISEVATGILLDGEENKTKPAILSFQDETHATLTLTEGKYHQVKRMMGYFGNRVTELHRSHIAHLNLDGLEKGECRLLTDEEVALFD